jgi:hypothetical protein
MKDPLSSRRVQISPSGPVAQHPRRRRPRSICPGPTSAPAGDAAVRSTSSEPEAEGDRAPSPRRWFFELGPTRRNAQASIRVRPVDQAAPSNEIRKTPPLTLSTVTEILRPSSHGSGSSSKSRHAHLGRLNGSDLWPVLLSRPGRIGPGRARPGPGRLSADRGRLGFEGVPVGLAALE